MSLSVTYDGIDLTQFIGIGQDFNAFNTSEWENELRKTGDSNGASFLYGSYGAKNITMPFYIKGDALNKYDGLLKVLNVTEPKRLTFGVYPNRYFLAKVSGKIDFTPLGVNAGRGTITWLIPDGVSHSINIKLTTATLIDGILTANVYNGGSDVVWPTYRLKSTADNGYYGIVHAGGTLELGNREDTEGIDYKQDEVLLNTSSFNESNWSQLTGTYPPDNRYDLSGALAVSGSDRDRGLRISNFGGNTKLFNGACIVYTLQADSEGVVGAENFYALWESYFWAGRMGQTGVQDFIFWSGNEIIARWSISKTDKNGNTAVVSAYAGNAKGGLTQVYSNKFTSSHLDTENPFNRPRGSMDFLKEGAKLRFYYWGSYPQITVPEFADKKITKVSIALANYDKRIGNEYVNNNAVRKLKLVKMHVDKWADVPNRYGDGSELVVDTESANIYLNGLPANDEAVNPPLFAPLQPGNNKIEFYQSDWSQSVPEITVETKERYL